MRISLDPWKTLLAGGTLALLGGVAPATTYAEEAPAAKPPAVARPAPAKNAGDVRKIDFVLPFDRALAKAKAEHRLLFVKPIYGGVDEAGAKDYRCGSW